MQETRNKKENKGETMGLERMLNLQKKVSQVGDEIDRKSFLGENCDKEVNKIRMLSHDLNAEAKKVAEEAMKMGTQVNAIKKSSSELDKVADTLHAEANLRSHLSVQAEELAKKKLNGVKNADTVRT